MKKNWTEKQKEYLRKNYRTGCMDEMSNYLNKSVRAIRAYAANLGVKRAASIHIHEYAMYNGDEFEMIGTAYEIGKALDIKPESVAWYASDVNLRRIEKSGSDNRRVAVRL